MAVLEIADVRKRFGGVEALRGVGPSISEGEVVGRMGDNGAGKSTHPFFAHDTGAEVLDSSNIAQVNAHEAKLAG